MSIIVKTKQDIEKMRIAGRLAAEVLEMIEPYVKPNITTNKLNEICHDYIVNIQHAIPAPLNYRKFPKSICASVNEMVCHGVPNDRKLKDSDIVNLDITIIKDGYFADTSKMFILDKATVYAKKLAKICQESLYLAIDLVKPGVQLGDIGATIQEYAESHGYSVVREYCGHGIGYSFHEEPKVLHFGQRGTGIVLQEGMIFTIEPMINLGVAAIKILSDKWTVITQDHKPSAQYEHTILVTNTGYEVLTKRKEEIKFW